MYTTCINTIYFGRVPIRRAHTDGRTLQCIELSDGDNAEIRADYTTDQPFAVLFDGEWNQK